MGYTQQDIDKLARNAVVMRQMLRDKDPQGFRKVFNECKELRPYSREAYDHLYHAVYTIGEQYYYHRSQDCFDQLIRELEYSYGKVFRIICADIDNR
jgi:hypothetical protein